MRNIFLTSVLAAAALLGGANAQAAVIAYGGTLSGAAETIPNASTATGSVVVTVDTIANTLKLATSFAGLASGLIETHVHCCSMAPGIGGSGVATLDFVGNGIPSGISSGSYAVTIDLTKASSFNAAFLTTAGSVAAAEAKLLAGIAADKAYVNLHTNAIPGGEIEAFLAPVPAPAGLGIVSVALLGLATLRRTRA